MKLYKIRKKHYVKKKKRQNFYKKKGMLIFNKFKDNQNNNNIRNQMKIQCKYRYNNKQKNTIRPS